MMSDVEEHRHKPLGSPDLIRVLDLQPSRSPSAPIQCKLRQVPLDGSGTTFEALSYVWGARAGDQPIICDGQRLLVTPNCHSALVQLRRGFRKRTLWIDAICINQRDDEVSKQERNHEVARMGEIYRRASCVLIWLDPRNTLDPEFFRNARYGNRFCLLTILSLDRKPIWSTSKWEKYTAQLLQDPWFSRVWTVQEVAFARSAVVMSNQWKIPFHILANAIRIPNWSHGRLGNLIEFRLDAAKSFNSFSPDSLTQPPKEHIGLFRCLPYLQCIQPHDKVYGFYAMIQKWGVELAPPDYEKDVSRLFQEVVVAFVQHNKSLEPLTTTLPASLATGLASWTPNWLTAQTTIGDDGVDMNGVFDVGFFRNGQLASSSSKATVKWDPGHGSIELRSKRIGDIMTLSSCIPEEPREPEQVKEFISECRNWCQANREEITSYTPFSISDLFAPSSFCLITDSSVWFHTMLYQNLNEAAAAILSPGLQPPQYLQQLAKDFKAVTSPEVIKSELQEISNRTQSLVNDTAHYAFFALDTGHLGRAHHSCQLGDGIWLLAGCDWPLVLRRQGDSFRIVAPAYIVGIMEGELWPEDEDTLETITLV
ncbi:HET-domain-containing protein [Apiospora arundinis]